ncbi:hypothetical protein GALL_94250 [mine drainage metagenome]|uniref:Protein BatD n=1 Tax=mine drainage metagenome TaxID=410659 RepID=A0A1J5SIG0_9ZZZZ
MRKKSQETRVKSQESRFDRVSVIRHLSSVFLLCFCISSFSFAQKISATVDRDKILIGEQIELKVSVTDIDKNNADVSTWFNLPDTFNHFEIIKRLPVDTISNAGSVSYSQKMILTSFDSGYWQIPAANVSFTDKKTVQAMPINISVLPVDVSNLKDYHDFKDIIEVKPQTNWLLIGSIAAAAIVLAILIFFLIKYLKKRKSKPKIISKTFGIKEALQQLDELQQKDLIQKNQHKLFFTEMIFICRNFSDQQLNIFSSNKTTDEYMLLLKNKIGNEPTQIKYFQLLRLADAVKFAKFIPSNIECDEAMIDTKTFVQTIYDFQFAKKN